MRRITQEDEIKAAIFNPPETTRAFFRGRAVAKFNDEIASIQWDENRFFKGRLLTPRRPARSRDGRSPRRAAITPRATAKISRSS